VLFEGAWGMADEAWHIPNTVASRFEIASLTKQFTGMAIAQLAAAGKLDLDAPISRYLPEAPASWNDITVDRLLTHTSGLPTNEIKDFSKGIAVPYSEQELIATFRDRPLGFKPGTSWRYTNTEYYLLAFILQRVSGESYADYLERHIFAKLGMNDTGFAPTTAIVESLAVGYVLDAGSLRERDFFDRSLEIGAGGVHSTTRDLLRWSLGLDRLLPKPYLRRVFAASNPGHYGYGWFVEHVNGGVRQWHEGSDPGYGAFIARRPDDRLLVVVLSNHEGAPVRGIAEGLERVANGR
jgi:CubicO group peptidase (beta-lactamase class C family)